jgi:folylpolyglutamate synthase/dihydropteroate synthase
VRRLLQSLRVLVDVDNVVLVFSALGGHSAEGMLEELSSLSPRVVAVQSRHPRSSRVDRIAQAVTDSELNLVAQADTVAGGLRVALETANAGDLILCTGSLALAAEVLEYLQATEPEIYENLRGPVHR